MKGGPLEFPVVPNKCGVLSRHLEMGPFPVNFRFPSIPGPFIVADKEFGHPR